MRAFFSCFSLYVALLAGVAEVGAQSIPASPDSAAPRVPALDVPQHPTPTASPRLTPLGRAGRPAELRISVTGLDGVEGDVRIAVFDDPEGFTDRPALTTVLPAKEGGVVWVVPVPPGRYAVAAVHDRDADGELDINFLGMPRERYGFSNDARGTFGPPSFGDASFHAAGLGVSVVVRVR